MPVYDYRCLDCNSTYDVYHKSKEKEEDVVCPSCGSPKHKKLMSVTTMSMGSSSSGSSFESSSGPSCSNGSCCGGACGID